MSRVAQMLTTMGLFCMLTACSEPTDTDQADDNVEPDGACGEVDNFDASVFGMVTDGGAPVEGATVVLEDRGWEPTTDMGSATTNAKGTFTINAPGLTSVEDCWGTLLDYVLVAEKGAKKGEKSINSQLHTAYDTDGSADVSAFPVEIE
jgi:hypothetical protein